ncbi:MAG: LytTR family DNA-binding domain-containing protein [Blastocatellia bacterium]|nr:LytTR family DNA-binding domain-containing protein [Blastocatellia bacterium]
MPQPQNKIRALIVDDEPLARRTLRHLLKNDPEITVIAECRNGLEAVRAIRDHNPDLLFLDVQMPEMDGFEVLNEVGADLIPVTIFITAYDRYALKAFEVSAVDYLLKPFEDARFERALLRAKEYVLQRKDGRLNQRLAALLDHYTSRSQPPSGPVDKPKYLQRIAIKSGGRIYFLKVEEIDHIEAADQYVLFHVGAKSHLTRESLTSLEARLDPDRFFRSHRSTIVNLERVKELQPNAHGDSVIVLHDGTRLKLSRNRREEFQEALTRSR